MRLHCQDWCTLEAWDCWWSGAVAPLAANEQGHSFLTSPLVVLLLLPLPCIGCASCDSKSDAAPDAEVAVLRGLIKLAMLRYAFGRSDCAGDLQRDGSMALKAILFHEDVPSWSTAAVYCLVKNCYPVMCMRMEACCEVRNKLALITV